ncbi:MAG: thymidylate synthase [Treponema sp.]|jgi:thymidylate synthase|nr:thymidylate synthase [Treponema sp.]
MKAYIDIVKKVFDQGVRRGNRTGVDALSIAGAIFEHDMAEGFPLLTTKRVSFRLVASELEFFIRGITDKEWLKERNNHIWDEWCSPGRAPYGTDEASRARMMAERDLGPMYGWQWRRFGAPYRFHDGPAAEGPGAEDADGDPPSGGIDQLRQLVETLKRDPGSRRMIVSAWNPLDLGHMALPPCHYAFQVTVTGGRLNLLWNQRSVDVALGLPFNIASYGLLLHLLAREAGLGEGRLVGFLGDTHIYVNHLEALREQIGRERRRLPGLRTENFRSLFRWRYTDSVVTDYDPHPAVKFDIAV